ncbi:AMP-dependent synthetase and ligase [Verrucomicrobia bacterium]|nr:AMP-dependent synthetase and ligase [Verrucomicrobiota bacterium]
MLYERWLQVARDRQRELALHSLADGRQWTFGELAASGERAGRDQAPVAFPLAGSVNFVFAVLRAWRSGQVVCPLEPGQSQPRLQTPLPPGIVHLKTTSATTGAPRLVAFTADQLMADAQNICATMGLRADWPNLGVISMAHSYGFSNLVLPLLLQGIPLFVVGSALPEAVRRAAARQSDCTLAAVPALWGTWREAKAIPANIRLAISAGAPMPPDLEQGIFAAYGLKVHNFYGSSECGGIAYDATMEPRADGSCAGAPLRNVELSVSEDGCLEVRGRAVAEGYWPQRSASLGEGLFRTSDLAELAGGLVFLRGRASDQINVAGRKVSPETIERALAAHPQVRECVAFGVPSSDAERGESIVACLALKANVSGEVLRRFLMEHLPAWQLPREWWFVETLGANSRGKLSRAEWRRRYLELANTKA